VVKNKEKPFIIHANKLTIKVLGTAFNVKAYPGEKNTETSLVRGSIEVTMQDRKDKIMMKPNDKLIVSNEEASLAKSDKNAKQVFANLKIPLVSLSHLTLARDESTIIETAWVENKLVFDNETFEEVALKMEKWYGVSIRITDEKLKSQQLTGTFEKETVEEALRALKFSTPIFKYEIVNQQIKIYKK
jgi:ferric-dicitrate binding protein FerR (iron transport regulator)